MHYMRDENRNIRRWRDGKPITDELIVAVKEESSPCSRNY